VGRRDDRITVSERKRETKGRGMTVEKDRVRKKEKQNNIYPRGRIYDPRRRGIIG
jgi:hypothetical protein